MPRLTSDQEQEAREVYALFCKSPNNLLSPYDLKICFRALGFSPKKEEISSLISKYGSSLGQIDMNSFLEIVAIKLNDRDSREEILKAFKLFDDDNTGTISFNNLKRVSIELGEQLSDDQLMNMINEADTTGSGEISEAEFVRIMRKTNMW